MIVRVEKRESPFVMIDRRSVEDVRLSWKARGLLAYLLSRPDSWQVQVTHLVGQSPDGECAVRSALQELSRYGYARLVVPRSRNGRVGGKEWLIYEVPRKRRASACTDSAVSPTSGKPRHRENPDIGENRRSENPDIGEITPLVKNESVNKKETTTNARVREDVDKSGSEGDVVVVSGKDGDSEKGDAASSASPATVADLSGQLVQRGVSGSVAHDLIEEYGREVVRRQITHLSILSIAGKPPKNPAAWLVEAIRGDYPLPKYLNGVAGPAGGEKLYTQPEAIAWCEKKGLALNLEHPITRYFEPIGQGKLRLIKP